MQEREEALFEQIRKEAHLSSKEAEKLMNKHLEDLKESNGLLSSSVSLFFLSPVAPIVVLPTCTYMLFYTRVSRTHVPRVHTNSSTLLTSCLHHAFLDHVYMCLLFASCTLFPGQLLLFLTLFFLLGYIHTVADEFSSALSILPCIQNAPDCISTHVHLKKFPGAHAAGPP